jgi:hypothetical protein
MGVVVETCIKCPRVGLELGGLMHISLCVYACLGSLPVRIMGQALLELFPQGGAFAGDGARGTRADTVSRMVSVASSGPGSSVGGLPWRVVHYKRHSGCVSCWAPPQGGRARWSPVGVRGRQRGFVLWLWESGWCVRDAGRAPSTYRGGPAVFGGVRRSPHRFPRS